MLSFAILDLLKSMTKKPSDKSEDVINQKDLKKEEQQERDTYSSKKEKEKKNVGNKK